MFRQHAQTRVLGRHARSDDDESYDNFKSYDTFILVV